MQNNNSENHTTDSLHLKELFKYRDLQTLGYGSRSTVWRKVKNGSFPAPLIDGDGMPFWTRDMLDEHIESCRPVA